MEQASSAADPVGPQVQRSMERRGSCIQADVQPTVMLEVSRRIPVPTPGGAVSQNVPGYSFGERYWAAELKLLQPVSQ
jgi:hypothetical protein